MKWLNTLLLAAVVVLVAACGGGSDETGTDTGVDLVFADTGDQDDVAEPEDLPGTELPPDLAVDPCDPNPCTEPPAPECEADGVSLVTYLAEGNCAPGDPVECTYDSVVTDCSEDGLICLDGECVEQPDPCEPNPCQTAPDPECAEDGVTLVTYSAPGTCTEVEGEPDCAYEESTTDCSEDNLVCTDGECVDPCADVICDTPPEAVCAEDGITLSTYAAEGTCSFDGTETSCAYEETTTDCSQDGLICVAGECLQEGTGNAPAEAGVVIFSEFMAKSQGGSDKGEWIEIHNPTETAYDLAGCVLADQGSDSHEIASVLVVPAGGYVVLARSDVPEENHGLEPDYIYSGTSLSNTDDELVLTCGEVEIDVVIFNGSVVQEGYAAQLDAESLDALSNDDLANWCLAGDEYGTAGKFGTPGSANVVCPEPSPCEPNPCIEPPDATCQDGGTLLTYPEVGECTDNAGEPVCDYPATPVNCTDSQQVCIGGECVDPPENPCDPNPCDNPPAAECDEDGITLVEYVSPGTCLVVDNLPQCEYATTTTDCSAQEKICVNGVCAVEGTGTMPDVVGQVIFTEFMAKSMIGTDTGEWVELANVTDVTVDLNGCVLHDLDNDTHTIDKTLILLPGQHVVLARSDVPADNHGLPFDYIYSGFVLSNTEDELVLTCGELLVDQVVYDETWVEEGVARQLQAEMYLATANDEAENWCSANQEYGTAGKLGTPGALNSECGEPDACVPNPCTTPEPGTCLDGVTLDGYAVPGTCTIVNDAPSCEYQAAIIDCSEQGLVCKDGACVSGGVCEPNPCDKPPAPSCQDDVTALTYEVPGDCTDNAGMPVCDYTMVPVDCSLEGKVCIDGQCLEQGSTPGPSKNGDLVITEFMARSQANADPGEWVELRNVSGKALDLGGCFLQDDDNDSVEIDVSLEVADGEFVLLARSGDAAENHGLPTPDFVYGGGFQLSNSIDEIMLVCNGVGIDHVAYETAWVTLGASTQLDPDQISPDANDILDNWCTATEPYGTADKLGTPGAVNPACPE